MTSRVKTILFTDVQGFAQRTSGSSRDELMDFLASHDALLLPAVRQLDGEVIKTIGDALMVSFDSPTNAVLCGMLMQAQLREYNASHSDQPLQVRIAINSGEVEQRNKDLFGEAVTIAARIVDQTKPGEVYFTEAVYLSMNKVEAPTAKIAAMRLKGIEQEIRLFRLIQEEEHEQYQSSLLRLKKRLSAQEKRGATERLAGRQWFGPAMAVSLGLLIITALLLFMALPSEPITSHYSGAVEPPLTEPSLTNPSRVDPSDPRLADAQVLLSNEKFDAAISRFSDIAEVRAAVLASQRSDPLPAGPARPEAFSTAIRKAALAELPWVAGNISNELGWPLVAILLSDRVDSDLARQLQQRLSANFPPARPWFEQQLRSDNPQRRRHALAFLKQNNWLSSRAELASHLQALSTLSIGYRQDLEAAIRYISSEAEREDWSVRKRQLLLPELQSMMIWRRRELPLSPLQERAGQVLLEAFPKQFRLRLQEASSQGVADIYQPAVSRLSEMAASTGHH